MSVQKRIDEIRTLLSHEVTPDRATWEGTPRHDVWDIVGMAEELIVALKEIIQLRAEIKELEKSADFMRIALRAYEYEFSWDGERHWAGPEEGPAIARRALRAINDELVSDA